MSFPLTPPPANDLGAITWPRRLQRWLDDNPVGALTRTSTYFSLPIFVNQIAGWGGYSDIIESFNFESPNAFCIKSFTPPVNPNYACTIAFAINTTTIVRYLLWDAAGSSLPAIYQKYTNQTILKNFRLEIWSVNFSGGGYYQELNGVQFTTSKMGPFDYRYGTDGPLVTADAPCTSFGAVGQFMNFFSTLTTASAGSTLANGLYQLIGTTPAANGYVQTPVYQNISRYTIVFNTVSALWLLTDVNRNIYYSNSTTPTVFNAEPPTSGWSNATYLGVLPEPSLTIGNNRNATIYTLPLTFPSGSYSTTN